MRRRWGSDRTADMDLLLASIEPTNKPFSWRSLHFPPVSYLDESN